MWIWVQWVVGGLAAVGGLVVAISTAPKDLPRLRQYWLFVPLLVFWTGDAAVGANRPVAERVGKGVIAVALWAAIAIAAWRRRRHRLTTAAVPTAQPRQQSASDK